MGLFDEFTETLNVFNDIKKEIVELGTELVKEAVTEANNVKKTVVDTADELKNQAEEVKHTVTDTAEMFKDEAIDVQSVVKQSTTINITHVTQPSDDSAPIDNQAA